jgi:hypothetical protein
MMSEILEKAGARFTGFGDIIFFRPWGLRPRLYAFTCSAG